MMQTAKLEEQISDLRRQVDELSFLVNVSTSLLSAPDRERLLESILEMAMSITHSEQSVLLLPYPLLGDHNVYSGELLPSVPGTIEAGSMYGVLRPAMAKGPLGRSALDGLANLFTSHQVLASSVSVVRGQTHPLYKEVARLDPDVESFVVVPLTVRGRLLGYALLLHHSDDCHCMGFHYHSSTLHTLTMFAEKAALILEYTRLHQSHRDRDAYRRTIEALSSAIDAKDPYTRDHSRRVAELSTGLASQLGLPSPLIDTISYGATLHDVGKIGVPETVLNKNDRLNNREFDLIREHPLTGARILEPVATPEVLHIVRHHHERFDGHGYPDGLAGKDIPLGARIVAIADAWDAMTSHRAYRAALSFNQAKEEILRCQGTQFDPEIAGEFIFWISNPS